MRFPLIRAALLTQAFLWVACTLPASAAPSIRLIGVSQADQSLLGLQAESASSLWPTPSISSGGRYVVFDSVAGNLVAGDTNAANDVFLRDLATNTTRRVSVTASGAQISGADARNQTISEDGRYIAFITDAPGLVPADTDGFYDVFVNDTQDGSIRHASVSSVPGNGGDASWPSISLDGRYVAFVSAASDLVAGDGNATYDVFVRDLQLGTTVRASVADGTGAEANSHSSSPRISRDGGAVVFQSNAANLVASDTNNSEDTFVRFLSTGTTVRASVGDAGQESASGSRSFAASPSAAFIAFESNSANLVPGDTNGQSDIFLRAINKATTIRVSLGAGGEANGHSFQPSISGNGVAGQYVAFASLASNLVAGDSNGEADVFVRRIDLGTTVRASVAGSGTQIEARSESPSITADGRHLAFVTSAEAAVTGDSNGVQDVFVRDLADGTTVRASLADSSGPFPAQATGESYLAGVSDGGRHVAFVSAATNLVPGDLNGFPDAFVRDTSDGSIARVSLTVRGGEANSSADSIALSADGSRVIFESAGDNLLPGDTAGYEDVFLRDLTLGTTTRVSRFGSQEPNSDSVESSASADGRYVAYLSGASNFPGGATTGVEQVYLVDTQTGTTTLASVNDAGVPADARCEGSSVSDNGRYVVFATQATNLVAADASARQKIVRRDLHMGRTELVSAALFNPPADANSTLHSRAISTDGRYVAFESDASNLVPGDTNDSADIFVRDMLVGTTTRASVGNSGQQSVSSALTASISGDGRFVAFETNDDILDGVPGSDFQIVLRDLVLETTQRISSDGGDAPGNDASRYPVISHDGRNIAFQSYATNWNLVDGGQNAGLEDVFVVQLVESTTATITTVNPSPSAPGGTALVTVHVEGSASNPRGARLQVSASTGESCRTPMVVYLTPTVARAACLLTFASSGPRSLTASWPGTANYLASTSPAVVHSVNVPGQLFGNGFEDF